MALLGLTSLTEMFFDKQTGEILEIIVDGEIKAPAIEERVIVEQRQERIMVLAGTFDSLYSKLQINDQPMEEWVNSKKIPIFGLLRQHTASDMGGLSLELKKYKDL